MVEASGESAVRGRRVVVSRFKRSGRPGFPPKGGQLLGFVGGPRSMGRTRREGRSHGS